LKKLATIDPETFAYPLSSELNQQTDEVFNKAKKHAY